MSCLRVILLAFSVLFASAAFAVPVDPNPRYTFAGNVDFAVTAQTLRTESNADNSCAVGTTSSAVLSGIPAGSTIQSAFLYWAGSGPTPDLNVNFNGAARSASRSFLETFSLGALSLDFFSGFADVTAQVTGNGTYTFGGLTVTTTGDYCTRSAVLAGWGLIVVYENPAEPLRVINVFDGFQSFRGSSITLTPNNFLVPPVPIDGRLGVLSWEGDVENSATLGGVSENIVFDGQSTAPINLTDALNPINNQFNSTVNVTGSSTTYGVDFDVYDISARLAAGDSSAETVYSSGGDLVLLSAEVISVTNTPVADLALDKRHVGDFSAGAPNAYTFEVSNAGPAAETGPIVITDTLPAGLGYLGFASVDAGWACSASGQDVTCTHPGPLADGASLPVVDVTVSAAASAAPSVNNTASVTGALFDPFPANDSDTDATNIIVPDLTTSTKSVVPVAGFPVSAGDTLRYTITLNETAGAAVQGASVIDTLDALLTNLVVTADGGGTDNSAVNTLQIDDLVVPANGSVVITFEADIVGGAPSGSVISNAADITNPADGSTTTVNSADVAIGNVPTNGIKPLYMGDIDGSQNSPALPMPIARTPLGGVSNPVRVRIRRQDDDRVWALTPALQADLSLDGSTMPVYLYMRRNNATQNRDIRVTLSYRQGATTTLIGCEDLTLTTSGAAGLVNNETREFVFNVERTDASCAATGAGAFTIPAGAEILLQVDNDPAGGTGRAIFVYPVSDLNGADGRVELPATTVINVDTTEFYDAGFNGGSVQSAFGPGDSVFVRSTVSDPFGTFDISSVSYEILDPGGTPVATGNMPQVQDSGAATAIYETSYVVPAAPAVGFYTVNITANEGTEGTVSHTASFSFQVVSNLITLEKFVLVASDPVTNVNNPKAIPLAIVEYTIRATNGNGPGSPVDTVVIADSLPPFVRLNFAGGFGFVDGSPSSALSFTYGGVADGADDVRFSNDGGTTFVVPSVDGAGFDATVPPVNFIEFTPQGTFAPDNGGGSPSFDLIFQVRVE